MPKYIKELQKVENHWFKKMVGVGSLLGFMIPIAMKSWQSLKSQV